MVTAENIITEVRQFFLKESQAGNIDDDTLYRFLLKAFKRYGNDVMVIKEEVIPIENYNATLPEDVFTLEKAFRCNPCGIDSEIEHHQLINSDVYVERVRKDTSWDSCSANSCQTMTESVVRENVYFKSHQKSANFLYNGLQRLTLKKGFVRKDQEIEKMLNQNFKKREDILFYEGRHIQTGFKKGHVYIEFKGIPTDEDGVLEFEDSPSSSLSDALIAELIADIAPHLIMANGPSKQDIGSMLQMLIQNKKEKRNLAANEVKMVNFTLKDQRDIAKRSMTRRARRYEVVWR